MPDLSPRQLLLGSIAYAVKRLPKELLLRLQREHVTDQPAAMAADHILRQLELTYRVTEAGLVRQRSSSEGPTTTGSVEVRNEP
jgi:hypothetical protein